MKQHIIFILLTLLAVSCGDPAPNTNHLPTRNRFQQIDSKLNRLAKQLGTTVATTGGGHFVDGIDVPENKVDMRRIVWVDGEIGKAIIIGQNFENTTFDSPHWDFLIVAWLEVSKLNTSARPMWKKHLLNKVSLDSIVTRIDQLLLESLRNLSAIKKDDLRYD